MSEESKHSKFTYTSYGMGGFVGNFCIAAFSIRIIDFYENELLLGIFWKRTTQWGGLAGLVGGIMSSGLMYLYKGSLFTIEDPFLYVSWWSFVVGFIITIVVSLFTRSHPVSRLYGLVYRLKQPQAEGAA